MKKKAGIIVLLMLLICSFSVNVFAAPATPVTSVQVTGARISGGDLYVTVKVIGYGKNQYVTYDGRQLGTYSSVSYIGSNPVTGFYYTYNCGTAVRGTHTFTYRTTSTNSPWNTMSTSANITIN